MTNLQDKAIELKGKSYVLVKDRVLAFNADYPNGKIETELLSYEGTRVVVRAKVTPDVTNPDRYFTGLSQADETQGMVNKMAALENCETSAAGRALAMMGIGVIESIASADEIVKATTPTVAVKEPLPWEGSDAPNGDGERMTSNKDMDDAITEADEIEKAGPKCQTCGAPATFKSGISKKTGKEWNAYFCSTDDKTHARFV